MLFVEGKSGISSLREYIFTSIKWHLTLCVPFFLICLRDSFDNSKSGFRVNCFQWFWLGNHSIATTTRTGLPRNREFVWFVRYGNYMAFAPKIFLKNFYTENLPATQGNFWVIKIKWCTRIVVGYSYNLLAFNEIWVEGKSHNGMKFLQQSLLHLRLWFRMYIGSCISLSASRISVIQVGNA